MIKVGTTLLLCLLSFFVNAQKISSFRFDKSVNPSLAHNIICTIYNDSEIVGLVPYNTQVNELTATFETEQGAVVSVNNVLQVNTLTKNDFNNPVIYTASGANESKSYLVKVVYTGLPAVFIYTDNEAVINSKDTYVNGNIYVYPDETGGLTAFTDVIQIKGRGNSTWNMPKKPYKIKLSKKGSVLGMAADKEWVLLANYSDKSLLRTAAAFETSRRLGMPYTPSGQSVDLFLNEKYEGTYYLTEQIKIASSRVNITEMKSADTTSSKITGGYLLEVDERLDEDLWFRTSHNVPFTIKEPDLNTPQFNYIRQYVQQAEDALYGNDFTDPVNGYAAYLNTETFVNWYLVNELFKNNDAAFYSSVYLFKDKNGKLSIGPVWDFDIAAGNIDYSHCMYSYSWWVRNSVWIGRLFEDPAFKARVKARWNELKELQINTLTAYIENQAAKLGVAQEYNFKKWDILSSYVWPNAAVMGSYNGEISYLKAWLTNRIAWMDSQLSPKAYHLIAPQNNSMVLLDTKKPSLVDFNWSASNNSIQYHFTIGIKGASAPLINSLSRDNGTDTSIRFTSQELITLLQNMGYNIGDSVTLTWQVYAMLENDSVASATEFDVTLKIKEILAPFNLSAPADNEVINIPSNTGAALFNWSRSKFAGAYNVFLSTQPGQIIHVAPGANKGADTLCLIPNKVINTLLNQYGTAYGDSVVLNIRWTTYAYLNSSDSLKAQETNWLVFYRINMPPPPIPKTVNLVYPVNGFNIVTASNKNDVIRFSWKPDSNSASLSYKLICSQEDSSWEHMLFERSTRDTFVDLDNDVLDSMLKAIDLKKGDSVSLIWTIYTYLDGETEYTEANQSFVLNCKRGSMLSPFSIITPTGNPYIVSYAKDSFPNLALQWQTAGATSAVYYKVTSSLSGTVVNESLSDSNGLLPSVTFDNTSISQLINTDSAFVEYHVIAYDNDADSLVCSNPASVLFILKTLNSGVGENNTLHYSMVLYPNPANGELLTVGLNNDKPYALELFDLTGKSVYRSGENRNTVQVPVKQLGNGIYFCRITGEEIHLTRKFIISR